MAKSIEFCWNPGDFEALVKVCQQDEGVQLALQYLTDRRYRVLEAGCGSGRVVKYLHDLGYQSVSGIELNTNAVRWVNEKFPELNIVSGDLLNMPFEQDVFDVVVSFGVIEHFPAGLDAPLLALKRVLKPGGIAVITVPSVNTLRRIGYAWTRCRNFLDPRRNSIVRSLFRVPPLSPSRPDKPLYQIFPSEGPFFEYRLTRDQFEDCCLRAGFQILRSVPISHMDGLYHQFGPKLIKFEKWVFTPTRTARLLNATFKMIPFFHNHMHACVVTKTSSSTTPA